jgi:hypothetical protein
MKFVMAEFCGMPPEVGGSVLRTCQIIRLLYPSRWAVSLRVTFATLQNGLIHAAALRNGPGTLGQARREILLQIEDWWS